MRKLKDKLRKRKAIKTQKKKLLISSSPVLLCIRIGGFVISVTYTQCSPVCSRQSLYKVNNNWPCWGHSLLIFELPLFAVPLQRPGEADYKSCNFPEITTKHFCTARGKFSNFIFAQKCWQCFFFYDKQVQSDNY